MVLENPEESRRGEACGERQDGCGSDDGNKGWGTQGYIAHCRIGKHSKCGYDYCGEEGTCISAPQELTEETNLCSLSCRRREWQPL